MLASLQSKLAQLMHINVQFQPAIHYAAEGEPTRGRGRAFKIEYVNKALCARLVGTHSAEYLLGMISPLADTGYHFKLTTNCV